MSVSMGKGPCIPARTLSKPGRGEETNTSKRHALLTVPRREKSYGEVPYGNGARPTAN